MNFLRFPDESTWTVAATEAGLLIDDTLTAYTHGHAIDVVGTIPVAVSTTQRPAKSSLHLRCWKVGTSTLLGRCLMGGMITW